MAEVEGLTIRYQGKTCAPEFSYSRSVGLEPSRGFVIMEQTEFGRYDVKEKLLTSVAGETPPPGHTTDAGAGLQAGVSVQGIQSAGTLEYIEVINGKTYAVQWDKVLVGERSIEAVEADDDGVNVLCKVELSDIRELWETRGGPITAWINIPKPVDSSPTQAGPNTVATGAPSSALLDTSARIAQIEGSLPIAADSVSRALAAVQTAVATGDSVAVAQAQKSLSDLLFAASQKASQFQAANTALALQQDATSLAAVNPKLSETGLQIVQIDAKLTVLTDNELPGAQAELARATAAGDQVAIFQAKANVQSLQSSLSKLQADKASAMADFSSEAAGLTPATPTPPAATSVSSAAGLLIPGSTDSGKPWILRRVLDVYILPELWGQPTLKYIDPKVAAIQVSAKLWEKVRPKKALAQLLAEYRLELALNFDSSVSIWKKGEGQLQSKDGTIFTHPPFAAISDDPATGGLIAKSRPTCTFTHVPQAIVVTGAPIIAAARVKLEAVGMRGGKIVPLIEALVGIGLLTDEAAALVMQPNERRAALLGVTTEGLHELARWGFKWFRLPGGPEKNSHRLPILEARAAFGATGELLPLRVFSESHAVISVLEAALAGGKGATGFVIEALKQIGQVKSGQFRAAVNVPFGEQATGFTIDTERGIVMFSSPQGLLKKPGVALNEARLDTTTDPRVELEFAYKMRPGLQDNVALSQSYYSVWARNADGTATKMSSLPPGIGALTIERPDFQQVNAIDNTSNSGALDAIARGLAEQRFSVPSSQTGAVVEFCRPVPIVNTGQVLSVVWAVNNEIPSVTAHVNNFEKLAPVPLRTTDFDTFRFDGVTKGSTFAPKGLTP